MKDFFFGGGAPPDLAEEERRGSQPPDKPETGVSAPGFAVVWFRNQRGLRFRPAGADLNTVPRPGAGGHASDRGGVAVAGKRLNWRD